MTVVRRQVAGRSLPYDVGRHGRLVFSLLVGALVVASAVYLAFDHRAYWREAEQRLASVAGVVAEYVQQVISIADLTLHSIDEDRLTDEVVISRPSSELHELLKRAQSMSPVLQGLGLIDARGLVVASATSPVASRADLSDRDYFQVHSTNGGAGLFIGRPVIARPQNVVSLPVSRRAVLPGGSFAGVVAARIDPRIFDTFFEAAGVDVIAVVRPDGIILARYPSIDLVTTPSQSQTEVLIRAQTEPRGIATLRSTVDGIDRLVAFQVIPNPKLVVAVAFASNGITLAWINRIYPFLALLVGGLAFLAVIARLVQRHSRASEVALAETAAARATAEQLADVKGAFLANMSHEIRTPLGGMLGYADLLLKSRLDRQQVDWAIKLKSAGDQLLAVINDILDYSKLESGNFNIDPKPVPLEAVVDEVRSMMTPQAEARGLELRGTFDPTLPRWVRLDPVRLKQILINLLSNAIKFTDRGVVAINVGRGVRHGASSGLKIDVADTGIGIADDKIASVFERFTQVETHAARGRGGTGLGLSISRRLAELMGGSLTLESRLGIGTTAHLSLPLEAVAEPPPETASLAAGGRTGNILLVDDLPMNLEIAGAMLRAQGHQVITATSGTEAVDAAVAGNFDVILLDISLPDLDGYEVAREIRKLEQPGRRIPIIALTANALPEHVAQALEAGMDAHLAKPIDERELAAQLAAVLGRQPSERAQPIEGPLIDRRATDTLRRVVGAERMDALKATFWTTWAGFVAGIDRGSLDRRRLVSDTHDMVSHAGNVGYRRLADICREVSHFARDEAAADLLKRIDRMREIADETRRADGR
jgi:signal transduction histidine kinase/DNA-binding NarL/FixJ family response regulator